MRVLPILVAATMACSAATALAAPAPHTFTARITVTGTQGAPTSKGIPGALAGRGRSPQFGKVLMNGKGYQRQGPTGDLLDNLRGTLTFASRGSVSFHLVGTERFTDNMMTVVQSGRFTITGGSGAYAHATGKGTMHASCPNDPNSASLSCQQTWKGTIRY